MSSDFLQSERRDFRDPLTGRAMIQWTSSPALDRHLYFTSQSVTDDDRWLVFLSERDGDPNFYAIERASGRIRRLTDNRHGSLRSYCYPSDNLKGIGKSSPILDPTRNVLYYIQDGDVRRVGLEDGVDALLYRLPEGWWTSFSHISPDGKTLCVPCTDPAAFPVGQTTQWDQLGTVPELMDEKGLVTRLYLIDTATGQARVLCEIPFWVTHVNFAPDNSGRMVVNSEGFASSQGRSKNPRIWCVEADGSFRPFFTQPPGVEVNHENWDRSENIVVYHGSVPSEGYAFVAARTWEGELVYEYRLVRPSMMHATPMLGTRAALIDRSAPKTIAVVEADANGQPVLTDICEHGSDDGFAQVQDHHPHPLQTPDGKGVVFAAARDGRADVFEVRL